jgi:hypothetical protein
MDTDMENCQLVGRVTLCAPWLAYVRTAGRGLPALPHLSV